MRIVTECQRTMPTNLLPILAGVQPAELHRQEASLSLAYCSVVDPKHLLHELMVGSTTVHKERLRSQLLFVPAALSCSMNELSKLSIRA